MDTPAHIQIGPAPNWRLKHQVASASRSPDRPLAWLLEDRQFDFGTAHLFVRQTIKHQKDDAPFIRIPFNPSRESLVIHQVKVWREKQVFDITKKEYFRLQATFATLTVTLETGDIIDLHYSLIPHFSEEIGITQPLEFDEHRQTFFFSVIVPEGKKAKARFLGEKSVPSIQRKDDGTRILTWRFENTRIAREEEHPTPTLSISEAAGRDSVSAKKPVFAKTEPGPNVEYKRRRRSAEEGYPKENKRKHHFGIALIMAVALAITAAGYFFLKDKPTPKLVTPAAPAAPVHIAPQTPKPAPPVIAVVKPVEMPPELPVPDDSWKDAADILLKKNDLKGAEKIYREALAAAPSNIAACVALTQVLLLMEDENSAIAALEKFIETTPGSSQAWHTLSTICLKKRDLPSAIWAAEKAEDLAPDDADISRTLAESLYYAERFAEAEVAYERSAQMAPDAFISWQGLGLCCMRLHQYEDAVSALKRAIVLEPHRPTAINNLAAALMHLGDNEAAEVHLRECIAIAPDYELAWENLVDVYRRMNKPDRRALAESELAKIRDKPDA